MPELMEYSHMPVLLNEVLEGLRLGAGATIVDCTVGLGGHAEAILERTSPNGLLIGVDIDGDALMLARRRLEKCGQRVALIPLSFADIRKLLEKAEFGEIDGFLFDLGLSSYQLETPDRGFSFQVDGPLDMRMDRGLQMTAADLVNGLERQRLEVLLWEYGEERWAKRIAKAIVKERGTRPIETTVELADLVARCIPRRKRGRIHPATKTFMALRIATNNELDNLKKGIHAAAASLHPGGRLCVISFHSLEDRIVKNEFRRLSSSCSCPPDFPVCRCDAKPVLKVITRKPVTASAEEIEANRKARSAKLRVAERI